MTPDERRLEHLAATCGPRVLGYLARPTAHHDAADVYAEVLATTWRRIAAVPGDDARALGWMIGTARRCLANHRRGSKRRLDATHRLEQTLATAAPPPEPDSCLAEAMAELAPDDAELLRLVYWDGPLGRARRGAGDQCRRRPQADPARPGRAAGPDREPGPWLTQPCSVDPSLFRRRLISARAIT